MAMVRGAVCNHRVKILLDTGSTTSLLSLDLARRLRLKLTHQGVLQVKGLGGVTTNVTAKASVKITLGRSMVYYMEIWVANIGENVECLLGMNFMVAAGVRISTNDGNVHLPDEERIPLVGAPGMPRVGREVAIHAGENATICPGRTVTVNVPGALKDPLEFEIWATRGTSWLTSVLFDPHGRAKKIRIVNISKHDIELPRRAIVAVLVEHGYLPSGQHFVRVGSIRYREWQQLIYENSLSREFVRRQDYEDYLWRKCLPPTVERPVYPTPKKILVRTEPLSSPVPLTNSDFSPSEHALAADVTSAQGALGISPALEASEESNLSPQEARLASRTNVTPRTNVENPLAVENVQEIAKFRTSLVTKQDETKFQKDEPSAKEARPDTADPIDPFAMNHAFYVTAALAKLGCNLHHASIPYATGIGMSPHLSDGGDTRVADLNRKQERLSKKWEGMPPPRSAEHSSGLAQSSVEQLTWTYLTTSTSRTNTTLEDTVYYHEGNNLISADVLRGQLAMLPEFEELEPQADLKEADVGEDNEPGPKEIARLKKILEKHAVCFLGHGNALPPPARGVVCDLNVGDAKPIRQRARQIPAHLLPKVYELLKRLLETHLIEFSFSDWASPIVIVMKKNGIDIRLCIDYRLVNGLIKLMNYPLPLIDELIDNFETSMWFLSLDMASGFWAIPMTERAKLISAFICPLGHFQWLRMPFGLKNAPLIYQQVIDNVLWGFVRLSPEDEATVDQEVLEFLQLTDNSKAEVVSDKSDRIRTKDNGSTPKCTRSTKQNTQQTHSVTDASPSGTVTVFQLGRVMPEHIGSVMNRSSYIDDIAYGASTWDELCKTLNNLLYRLRYWRISVSLPKSSFGKRAIAYLSHRISRQGIEAIPKIVKGLQELPFPTSLKSAQSFIGSLNYYSKFIEDFPAVAAALYELTDEQIKSGQNLDRARQAFDILKAKIVKTPILRHPDREKPFSVILHANPWAISAVLGQEHDGMIYPVRFTGRVLQAAELRYHPQEKEVLALLRVLHNFHSLLVGGHVRVYTRDSTMKWLFTSKSLKGRCLQWATMLSPWSLEFHLIERDEDGLAALLSAGITPREHLDAISANLVPIKAVCAQTPPMSLEMLAEGYEGYLLSFDGAAKLKTRTGSAGYVLWKLPEWKIIQAHGVFLENVTVNEAEYHGLLNGLRMVLEQNISDLVVVGDSRIVLDQTRGLISCLQPHLMVLLRTVQDLAKRFQKFQVIHVKREFNAAADYLTGKTLRQGVSVTVEDFDERQQIESLNRLPEKLMKNPEMTHNISENAALSAPLSPGEAIVMTIMTRSRNPRAQAEPSPTPATGVTRVDTSKSKSDAQNDYQHGTSLSPEAEPASLLEMNPEPTENIPDALAGEDPTSVRWKRIRDNQDVDPPLCRLKAYLRGDLKRLTAKQAEEVAKIADNFVLDSRGILHYVSKPTRNRPRDQAGNLRLVVPSTLQMDILHHCHEDMQGGHQGVKRTYERLRREFYWIGMYADVEDFIRSCVDCATAKGVPRNPGPSPGNIIPEYPFQVVSMDFVIPLPKSARGNTALLLFQDMFSGYVLCKPMQKTEAQEVAEAYEEVVFRRFGASQVIRHDRDPRFMSEVFMCFRAMMGSRQRATLAYRPQANGQQERSVQTVVRSVKTYVEQPDQSDWDDLAERLMFALNTAYDATRLDTPFFLVHGWDAKSTLHAMLGPIPKQADQRIAYEWRLRIQREHEYAQAWARDLQEKAKKRRAQTQNDTWKRISSRLSKELNVGDAVWLYLARVKPGLSKKLAHTWHGPFRIVEKKNDFMYKLKIDGTSYRFYPWVHISRLKTRVLSPTRPREEPISVPEEIDFDAALLPEDSWEPDELAGEYEVEAILDVRWKQRRGSRRSKEYLVKWVGYTDSDWVPVSQLNCGQLLYDFDKSAKARSRFAAMQSNDEDASES